MNNKVIEWLKKNGACSEAVFWVGGEGEWVDETVGELVGACDRGDWLLWTAVKLGYPKDVLLEVVRPSVLRAIRVYTADRLCEEEGDKLRDIPDDVSWSELQLILDGKPPLQRVAWAVEHIVEDEDDLTPAWAALEALEVSFVHDEEPLRCANEVRAALPDLAQRLEAELCSMK